MAQLGVNKNGTEVIGEELCRCGFTCRGRIILPGDRGANENDFVAWCDVYDNLDEGIENHAIVLPRGSIKKLIGRELTWEDEAVEI